MRVRCAGVREKSSLGYEVAKKGWGRLPGARGLFWGYGGLFEGVGVFPWPRVPDLSPPRTNVPSLADLSSPEP